MEAVIGIDLGGTNCRAALVLPNGRTTGNRRMATRIGQGFEGFLQRLTDFCVEILATATKEGLSVGAIGLGTPGVIGADGMVHASPNLPQLVDMPLVEQLQERLHLPVTLINDANAIGWGEGRYGAGRGFASFLTVTLGTGVGGGLILGDRLWLGADGAAGEIGHVMVEAQGRPCGCGSRGCLEQYASARGIVRTVQELLAAGHCGELARVPRRSLSSRLVGEAARRGDSVALAALEEAGRRLGQVLAGVTNLLNLDAVIITGGPAESLDLMRPALSAELQVRAFAVPRQRLVVLRGELGDDAGILGAACMARDRLENDPGATLNKS
jgi:glucokinase